jgi:polyribonucleotide nucleotidyltransferase
MRVVDQTTGADITEQVGARPPRAERPEREDRGERGGRDRPRRDRGESAPVMEGSEQPPIGE